MSFKKEERKAEGLRLTPGYENAMISQPICLGLTNLVATCLKTQKLGHITQYLFRDFFFFFLNAGALW